MGGHPKASGTPRISAALIRGAQQFTNIFEIRTAALRADYEERIRALTAQRDALLGASQGQPFQGLAAPAEGSEIEALRAERAIFLRERADRERERTAWDQERAEWHQERARAQEERVSWNEERLLVEAERVRLDEERTRGNVEGTRWDENTLLLTREHAALLEERKQWLRIRKDLEDELSRVRHELQVTKVGYGTLQEQLASKNVSIMTLETRVRQLEEAGASGVRAHADADGAEDQQDVFEPLDFIRSPARSTTLATISAQSSTLSVKSPSLQPISTQVRPESPPPLPFPFDAVLNLSPTFSRSLLPSQLDGPAPPSPSVIFRLDCPPSPTKSSVASNVCDNSLITDVPTLVEGSGNSRSATSIMVTPPRRLVIRIPPSREKTRKSFKPSPPQFTEEERRSIVFVPRQPESDDDNNELGAAPDTTRTVQDP
uniref:FAD-binding monooxygenase BOA2 ) n=1 Tax=Ganoderma boninense TaxID=34458 RepID=A0A5K1K7V6_9APHY|nr:FAD-binding monooxygenase BOA2 (EC (Botcinic acid biosynthesis cluster A protein 2) [Ganoderma boninense]